MENFKKLDASLSATLEAAISGEKTVEGAAMAALAIIGGIASSYPEHDFTRRILEAVNVFNTRSGKGDL